MFHNFISPLPSQRSKQENSLEKNVCLMSRFVLTVMKGDPNQGIGEGGGKVNLERRAQEEQKQKVAESEVSARRSRLRDCKQFV